MTDSEGGESTGSSGSSGSSPTGPEVEGDCPIGERWLAEALAQHHAVHDVHLHQTDVRPGCGAGQAALSDILAVNVKYTLGGEGNGDDGSLRSLRLVVKLPPSDPFSRYFVAEAQFDLREIKFYTEVVPDLEGVQSPDKGESVVLPVPRCYYAHYGRGEDNESLGRPESALILEDIRHLGYRTANFSDGLTLKQAEAAMEAVARVHALSLVLSSRSSTPLSSRYPFLFQSERASDSYQQLLERGLPQLARFMQDRPGLSNVQASLEALRPKTRRLIEALLRPAPPMAVITHTDFWCNNLMFRERDGEHDCCILYWQMVTLSRPTNDLALLLVSSVSGELRKKHEYSLLDHYFTRVTSACRTLGEDIAELGWSKAVLRKEYRRSSLLALLLCLGSVDVALGDEKAEKRLEEALRDAMDQGLLAEEFIEEQLA